MLVGIGVHAKTGPHLQSADQKYPVKLAIGLEGEEIIYKNANVGQVAASLGSDASASQAAFDGNHLCPKFAQKPCDCAATASDFEDPVSGFDAQRPHQTVTKGAEIILTRPVMDRFDQLRREGAAIPGLQNGIQQSRLDFFPSE